MKGALKKIILTLLLLTFVLASSVTSFTQQRGVGIKNENAKNEKRLALVIGNGAYLHAAALNNPVNDATDMAATLKTLGFEVMFATNQSLPQTRKLVREFGAKLKQTNGVGLFYYAGHGIQWSGRNFLIPVEAEIASEEETEDAALDVNAVLRQMGAAGNGFNIVILDACRNNPFARSWNRDIGADGLAQISAPTGTLIAYATAPGETASDGGSGRNGLYTSELLQQMRRKNVGVEELFKRVRSEVRRKSKGKQVPWEASSIEGDFYFAGKENVNPIIERNTNAATQSIPVPQSMNTPLSTKYEYIPMYTVSILFDTGSAVLSSTGKTQLDQMFTKAMTLNKGYIFEIMGYADVIGSAEANARLSQLRAQEVIEYLVNQGVPLRRITTPYGRGESDPVGNSRTNEGHKLSRRVEVRILVKSGG